MVRSWEYLEKIYCYLFSGFSYSSFKKIQVLNVVMSHHKIVAIHYIAPALKKTQKKNGVKIMVPRWSKKWANPAKQSFRKCSTKNFHNLSWGMWHWAILLVATHETTTVEECTVLCIWSQSLLKPHHYFIHSVYYLSFLSSLTCTLSPYQILICH